MFRSDVVLPKAILQQNVWITHLKYVIRSELVLLKAIILQNVWITHFEICNSKRASSGSIANANTVPVYTFFVLPSMPCISSTRIFKNVACKGQNKWGKWSLLLISLASEILKYVSKYVSKSVGNIKLKYVNLHYLSINMQLHLLLYNSVYRVSFYSFGIETIRPLRYSVWKKVSIKNSYSYGSIMSMVINGVIVSSDFVELYFTPRVITKRLDNRA